MKRMNNVMAKKVKGLTVFAFALFDKGLVFDVLVTGFAVEPGPIGNRQINEVMERAINRLPNSNHGVE